VWIQEDTDSRARLQSDNIGKNALMVGDGGDGENPSGDVDSSRRRWCGFDRINGDHLQRTMAWVQENTMGD
jgi:hypothetical protein